MGKFEPKSREELAEMRKKAKRNGFAAGGHPRQFKYTYADMAEARGVSIYSVRKARYRGEFEKGDFLSVVKWCSRT